MSQHIVVPTKPMNPRIAAMPDGTPAERAAKEQAIAEHWAHVPMVRERIPDAVAAAGKDALDAFQREVQARALVTDTPAPTDEEE